MVKIIVSSRRDGSMKHAASAEEIRRHRTAFLEANQCNAEHAGIVRLDYDGDDYCRYRRTNRHTIGDGIIHDSSIIADAFLTDDTELTLFLPLADCIGAVLWDTEERWLMVSHLGRHNLEQDGGRKSVEYFVGQTGVSASDIKVYLSPAAGADNYPLFAFAHKGLHDVAKEQLTSAGILMNAIDVDERDTTINNDLYSHSEFLKGNRSDDGRFMIAARLHS